MTASFPTQVDRKALIGKLEYGRKLKLWANKLLPCGSVQKLNASVELSYVANLPLDNLVKTRKTLGLSAKETVRPLLQAVKHCSLQTSDLQQRFRRYRRQLIQRKTKCTLLLNVKNINIIINALH